MNLTISNLSYLAANQIMQVTVVVIAVGLFTRLFCRHRAHLAHAMWLLVLVKCLVPPQVSSPTGLFSWAQLRVVTATTMSDSQGSVAELVDDLAVTSGTTELATVPEAAVVPHTLSLGAVLLPTWLFGACLLGSVVVFKWTRVLVLVRQATPVSEEINALAEDLAGCLGVRRTPRLYVTRRALSPAIFGVFHPIVLLPESILRKQAKVDIEPIIAHELVHIRRYDALVAMFQVFIQILWWFHPFVWWANRQLTRERERACDEEVVASLAFSPGRYAKSLLDVLQNVRRVEAIFAMPGVHPMEITRNRLEHIMKRSRHFHRKAPRACWLVLIAAGSFFLPGAGLTFTASSLAIELSEPQSSGEASDQGDGNAQGGDAGGEAEATLEELGAKIERNDDGEVVGVWLRDQPQFSDADVAHLESLNWSKFPSTGQVGEFDYQYPLLDLRGTSIGNDGLRQITKMTQFVTLSLRGSKITDEGLVDLKRLTSLLSLDLSETAVTDDGLAHLKGLTRLKNLSLKLTEVTDDGLAHLKAMSDLEFLRLTGTHTTDRGLMRLKEWFPDLRGIWLSSTDVTDVGLAHLQGFAALDLLIVGQADISDDGMKYLKKLDTLKTLWLYSNDITSDGLKHLKDLSKLRVLVLSDTIIDDNGLVHLEPLNNLRRLSLQGNDLSDEAVEKLRRKLASCEISFP